MCFIFPEYALKFNTRISIILNFWEAFQHSPEVTGEKLCKKRSILWTSLLLNLQRLFPSGPLTLSVR